MLAPHALFASSFVFWPCLPLALPQALYLKTVASKYPGAVGPRTGHTGSPHPRLRLLALGDSPFDGVAIERIEDTMPIFLARTIDERIGLGVEWIIAARSGAKVQDVLAELWPTVQGQSFDLILVSVGVNDVTGLTRRRVFAAQLTRLLRSLRGACPEAHVVLLGIPPMHAFPLLPQPLRAWLGGRTRALDRVGDRCARDTGALHLPLVLAPRRDLFAPDGFHPSESGNALWAERVFAALEPLIARGRAAPRPTAP